MAKAVATVVALKVRTMEKERDRQTVALTPLVKAEFQFSEERNHKQIDKHGRVKNAQT